MNRLLSYLLVVAAACSIRTADGAEYAGFSEYDRGSISAPWVKLMIEINIPRETPKLIVLTQCFSGDVAKTLRRIPNSVVLSAGSPSMETGFGGYHDDAARALRPGAGRTARDVHNAGVAGRRNEFPAGSDNHRTWDEFPSTDGPINPEDFSLEPVTETSTVASRHLVLYFGKPDKRRVRYNIVNGHTQLAENGTERSEISDDADRDSIVQSFDGEPNTSVRTVGGPPAAADPKTGRGGWNRPGNWEGLVTAIYEAGQEIQNSPDPSREQFILFVGDHGEAAENGGCGGGVCPPANPNGRSTVSSTLPMFTSGSNFVRYMQHDPHNEPALTAFVDFSAGPRSIPAGGQVLASEDIALELVLGGNVLWRQDRFEEIVVDLDLDGIVGSMPGEGIQLRFSVDESLLLGALIDKSPEVIVDNGSSESLQITEISATTGNIARLGFPLTRSGLPLAILVSFAIAVLLLVFFIWRRLR